MDTVIGYAAIALDVVVILGVSIIAIAATCAFVAGACSPKTTSARALQPEPKGVARIMRYVPPYYAFCFLFAVQKLADTYVSHVPFDRRHAIDYAMPVMWTAIGCMTLLAKRLKRREAAARGPV